MHKERSLHQRTKLFFSLDAQPEIQILNGLYPVCSVYLCLGSQKRVSLRNYCCYPGHYTGGK